jgi:hypothetical protein
MTYSKFHSHGNDQLSHSLKNILLLNNMVMSYFRNGVKIDGVWQYSLALCMEEFGEEFPDIAVEYTQFRQTLNISLKNFQENGSVGRKRGSGRPKKRTPEVIEEARQAMEEAPGTSIEHLSQQLGVSVGTCHSIVKKDLHLFPYRLISVQELRVLVSSAPRSVYPLLEILWRQKVQDTYAPMTD